MRYTESELEDSLKKAFVDHKSDYIVIYDRHNKFLCESAALGVECGWLSEQFIQHDEQSSELRFRLTDVGARYFNLI